MNKKNWVRIAKKLNERLGIELRTAKQCRERYINHAVTPIQTPFNNQWSQGETAKLFQLFDLHGSCWTAIALELCNKQLQINLRSQNITKNKFYCSLRKFIRRMNHSLRLGPNKHKKQIKYGSVIRAMEACESFPELPEFFRRQSAQIRRCILSLSLALQQEKQKQIDDNFLFELAEKINKFNLETRSYKAKKQRNSEFSQKIQLSPVKEEENQGSKIIDVDNSQESKPRQQHKSGDYKMKETIQLEQKQILQEPEQNPKKQNFTQIQQSEPVADFQPLSKGRDMHFSSNNPYLEILGEQFQQDHLDSFFI